MSLYHYVSWLWEEEEQADENQKRQKYLVCEQIKNSKIKLKPIKPTKVKKSKRKYLPLNIVRVL